MYLSKVTKYLYFVTFHHWSFLSDFVFFKHPYSFIIFSFSAETKMRNFALE